uniref:Uncharacterized protein n=1 Tax=Arundo donax TaxID=35708 RepID=A0A0A9CWH4_ARUDO
MVSSRTRDRYCTCGFFNMILLLMARITSTLLTLSVLTMSHISRLVAQSGASMVSNVASSTILSVIFWPWKNSFILKLMLLTPTDIFRLTSAPLILSRSPRALTLSIILSLILSVYFASGNLT